MSLGRLGIQIVLIPVQNSISAGNLANDACLPSSSTGSTCTVPRSLTVKDNLLGILMFLEETRQIVVERLRSPLFASFYMSTLRTQSVYVNLDTVRNTNEKALDLKQNTK
jgi:hypothetical protein